MIGFFDSGSGGLTVLKAVKDVLPSADVIYFGDIKNAPYGSKTHEELSRLTVKAITLLKERGVHRIVSACNSVAATLAISLFDVFDILPANIIEMVGPTVAYFRGSVARILLVATPATIKSNIYQNAFQMIGKEITTLPIEGLAGAIEFGSTQEEIKHLIEEALTTQRLADFDVLVLACTHYPLVKDIFEQVSPTSLAVFDPALAVAERVERQFWPQEAGNGTMRFLISKDSAPFREQLTRLFPSAQYTVEVLE
jgi:glutamate racemase